MTPLEKKYEALRAKMLKAQSDYTQAVRKGILGDAALRKLADKGFKLEKEVFEMLAKLEKDRAKQAKPVKKVKPAKQVNPKK